MGENKEKWEKRKCVLVTGGAGFVGLNICAKFLQEGVDVVVLDKKTPDERCISELKRKSGKLILSVGNILDGEFVKNVIWENGVTDIIHGAAMTPGAGMEAEWGEEVFKINCLSQIPLLKEFADQKLEGRFLLLGSISAYGAAALRPEPLIEEISVAQPRSLYEISKFTAERIFMRYKDLYKINGCMARIGDVFGPWEHYSGSRTYMSLPYQATALAIKGKKAVFSRNYSGEWIYGPDLAEGVYRLWEAKEYRHHIYPLSSGERWRMTEWCELLKEIYPDFDYAISDDAKETNVKINQETDNAPMVSDFLFKDTGFSDFHNLKQAFKNYMDWISNHEGYVI